MRDQLLSSWKQKKKQKKKFLVMSCADPVIHSLMQDASIDCIRYDLQEHAVMNGFKDRERIDLNDICSKVKSITGCRTSGEFLAVDIPLLELSGTDQASIEKLINFYSRTNADILVIERQYASINLVRTLSEYGIPMIINVTSVGIEEQHLKSIKNQLVEFDSNGAVMIICDLPFPRFITELRDTLSIPLITTEKETRSDGVYVQFSRSFGLQFNEKYPQYLNLLELIGDAVKDCINDNIG